MSAWVVIDAGAWRSLPQTRQHEIRTWLYMNNIRPMDIPADSEIVLSENEDGYWEILHERFERSEGGRILIDPERPDEAYVRAYAVPLEVDPPVSWLTEVH